MKSVAKGPSCPGGRVGGAQKFARKDAGVAGDAGNALSHRDQWSAGVDCSGSRMTPC